MKPLRDCPVPPDGNTIVVASGNTGKLDEIRKLLDGLDVILLPQSELGIEPAEESGSSFQENALLKARHAASKAGLPAIADDSGLAVDALGGRPGVYSARYAGPGATDRQNIDRLLAELQGLPDNDRIAHFQCVAVFVAARSDVSPLVADGRWPGRILKTARGQGGFGYDPVFYDPALEKTAAEMTADEKNKVSHRGRAFRRLREQLVRRAAVVGSSA